MKVCSSLVCLFTFFTISLQVGKSQVLHKHRRGNRYKTSHFRLLLIAHLVCIQYTVYYLLLGDFPIPSLFSTVIVYVLENREVNIKAQRQQFHVMAS